MLLDIIKQARIEKYTAQTELRLAKATCKGLEVKLKKLEMQHELEKKNV
jgi:hypothetical protein